MTDFIPLQEQIVTNNIFGQSHRDICLHDGSIVRLQSVDESYDPENRETALGALERSKSTDKILTGLLYVDPSAEELHELMGTNDKALNSLKESALCRGNDALQTINGGFR